MKEATKVRLQTSAVWITLILLTAIVLYVQKVSFAQGERKGIEETRATITAVQAEVPAR